jgi:hypothetical protein
MPHFRASSPFIRRKGLLFIAGIAILLCLVSFSGCTQPVIPAPAPAPTTQPPSAPSGTIGTGVPPTATTGQVTQKGSDYLTYANSQYGFSLSYPSSWTKQENTGGNVVVFTAPSSGMGDIPATMRVAVDSSNIMSLEQYKAAQVVKKQGLDRFNVVYDLPYKGTGFSGWKIGYTYDTGIIMRSFEVYTIRGTTAYTIAFTSRDDKFAGLSVQSDTMFKSFQFLG